MTEPNPYAAPASSDVANFDPGAIIQDPRDLKKAQAVVKDAGQFWIAIILCLLCSVVGALLIPIWYTVRLSQWKSLSKTYPALVAPVVPENSFQAQFKSSHWKLVVGIVVGLAIFALVLFNVLVAIQGIK